MDGAAQGGAGAAQGGVGGGPGAQMPQGGFPQGGPPGARGMALIPGGPVASYVIIGLFVITLIVLAIAFYKMFTKAGMAGALGLLMLVPVVNLGVALYLAFAEWPVIAEIAPAGVEPAVPAGA